MTALLNVPGEAAAQQVSCDEALVDPSKSPYGYRLRGDRCEGTYAREIASTTLQVASLTESFENYDLAVGTHLRVAWTAPFDDTVWLRANALKPRLYYRMDTMQPADRTPHAWPTGILASLRIERRDLGVVGWTQLEIGGTRQRVYLPLRISQQQEAERSAHYQVVLVPGRELSEVYLHLAAVQADGRLGEFLQSGQPLHYGHYPAERAILISIPAPGVPGIYYLEIGADLSGGGVATTHLFFHHAWASR